MKKLIGLILIFFTSILTAWAKDNVTGDVLVVFKAEPGTTVTRESLSEGGSDYERVQNIAEELDAELVEIYVALSKARNVIFAHLHSETKSDKILLDELLALPDVLSASSNGQSKFDVASVSYEPNDTLYSQSKQWGLKAVRAPEAWKITTGDYNTYVAVIDSGVYSGHEDLVLNFDHPDSKNFASLKLSYLDENGHGTHVAGIIGAYGNNNKGVTGVNWRTNIISLRVANEDGINWNLIGTDPMIKAVNEVMKILERYPERRIVVNISMSGEFSAKDPETMIRDNDPYYLAFKTLSDTHRAVICVSAGNGDKNGVAFEVGSPISKDRIDGIHISSEFYNYPASFRGIENMIVVANAYEDTSYNTHKGRAYPRGIDSNYSTSWVDIAAPGTGIYSTISRKHHEKYDDSNKYTMLDGDGNSYQEGDEVYPYVNMSGTSMATPFVSGAAALLFSKYPTANAEQIVRAIRAGANSYYAKDYTKYGFLNIDGAFKYMAGQAVPVGVPIDDFNFPDEIFRTYISENLDKDKNGYLSRREIYDVEKIDISGKHVSSLEGIGNFTDLVSLNCSNTDLTSFSLYQNQSAQNKNLAEINLSYCTKLVRVYIQNRENLVSLDLQNCSALTNIYCYDNKKLKELNTKVLSALTYLDCQNCKISELDLTGSPLLDTLYCNNNCLSALDLRYCPLLTEDSITLESQDCRGMKRYDISSNQYEIHFSDFMPARENGYYGVVAGTIQVYASDKTLLDYSQTYDPNTGVLTLTKQSDYEISMTTPSKITYKYITYPAKTIGLIGYDSKFYMDVTMRYSLDIIDPGNYDDDDDDDEPVAKPVPLDEAHFPNEEFRNYCSIFDLNGNGKLSDYEISKVTSMTIPYSVGSLKGIEYFTSLEELDCRSTFITSLDISQNKITKLYCNSYYIKEIICPEGDIPIDSVHFPDQYFRNIVLKENNNNYIFAASNGGTSGITSLYLEGIYISNLKGIEYFKELVELHCGNNKITELNLTQNTKLQKLYCDNNQLANLNLNNNLELSYLSCEGNNISRLDISHNRITELYCDLGVEEIICNYGDLPIDVAHFPDEYFRKYILNNVSNGNHIFTASNINKVYNLESMNVGYWYLASLKGIEYFTGLKKLECDYSQLQELDLSSNTQLEFLRCNNNKITYLDISNNKIMELYCDNEVTKIICPAGYVPIDEVHFPDGHFRSKVLSINNYNYVFAPSNKTLSDTTALKLGNENYTDDEYKISTLKGIEYFTNLIELDCTYNKLTELDLSKNVNLEFLDCRNNELTFLDVSQNKLKALYCDDNVLEIKTPLKDLPIDSVHFPDANFRKYILSLNDNNHIFVNSDVTNITSIYIYGKNISSLKGIEYFIYLENLDCSKNNLENLALSKNVNLKWLDCRENNLTKLNLLNNKLIEELYSDEKTLLSCPSEYIPIDSVHFPDANFRKVVKHLSGNDIFLISEIKEEKEIRVHTGNISSLQGIEYFTEINELDCCDNDLVSLDLSKNSKLEYLYCTDNKIVSIDISNSNIKKLLCDVDKIKEIICPPDYIPIDEVHFPDRNFRAELVSDANNNCIFSSSDISNVYYLNTYYSLGISSLKGIEYFKELKQLSCQNNELVSLDLSQNTKLEYLECTGNNIKRLDISKNKIEYLFCDDTVEKIICPAGYIPIDPVHFPDEAFRKAIVEENEDNRIFTSSNILDVSTIDVIDSKASNLKGIEYFTELNELYCYNNALVSLDLSKNKKLQILICINNKLQELKINGCTELERLYCYGNNISELYVGDCLKLLSSGTINKDETTKLIYDDAYKLKISNKFTTKGVVKKPYSSRININGGFEPYTWTQSGTLPKGLKLEEDALGITLKGTPETAKSYTFTLKATDRNGLAASKKFTVTITKPVISGDIKASGVVKKAYSSAITISGGTSPYTWTKSGTLPKGLELVPNSTGSKLTIKSIPTTAKAYTFTLKATDKNGATASKKFTVKITKPTINGALMSSGTVKSSYSSSITISGGTSPYVWTCSGTLPSGLKISNNTSGSKLYLKGTPKIAKAYTFTLKATDKNGATASKKFTVTIAKATTKNSEKIVNNEENSSKNSSNIQDVVIAPKTEATYNQRSFAVLKVLSDDVLWRGQDKDEDLIGVIANEPLNFVIENAPSGMQIFIDDARIEGIEISDDGTFILPADFVSDDFKVRAENDKLETNELFISVEY